MATLPLRTVPTLSDLNRGFWTGGGVGELRLRRCQACGFWLYPPAPICPKCRQRHPGWEAASGLATLFTYTLNHKRWNPEVPVPYIIAIVELHEQEGLRLTSNIVNCEAGDLRIGMPLRVTFEEQGEFYVPVFEPDNGVSAARNVFAECVERKEGEP